MVDGRFDIADALILVEFAHQVERTLEFRFDIGVEFDTGFEPPEEIGCDREIAILGQLVAFAADSRVHAEDFLDHEDRGARRIGRARDIGVESAVVVQRGNGDGFAHGLMAPSVRSVSYACMTRDADPDRALQAITEKSP